jgi:hypothetical protein
VLLTLEQGHVEEAEQRLTANLGLRWSATRVACIHPDNILEPEGALTTVYAATAALGTTRGGKLIRQRLMQQPGRVPVVPPAIDCAQAAMEAVAAETKHQAFEIPSQIGRAPLARRV